VDDAGVRDRFLGTIEAEANRLTTLVNDLLVLSRADSHMLELRLGDVDVATLARESVERLAPQATSKGVRVEVVAPAGPAIARVDPYRIQQVLVNLLDNAIKYSSPGGTVTVSVALEADGSLQVAVRDEGPGISPEVQPHVFERFYRADGARSRRFAGGGPVRAATGAGLGLSIAKALVEAHGGRIGLESAVGEGTTVNFTLPAKAS
jgi:signal transduction histidine kinase